MIKEIPNINRVTDVDLYLWTLSRRDGHFPQSSPQPLLHGDSQSVLWLWLTISGSDCVAHLAEWSVLLGQTQDPPSGPTTRSKAPRSQSLFVLVRWTQRSSQRNPSLKWNISTRGICSSIRYKHTVLCQQSFPLHYHMKLNSSCNVSFSNPFLPSFIFHHLPVASVSPFGTIFHSIFMLFIGQNSSTPLFLYSSMSSPLLWEWPVFCKRSGDRRHVGPGCNHRERLFRPAQTGSQKQVTAPQHCPKCWICECVCWCVCV